VNELRERVGALLAAPPSVDLAEPNALAGELADVRAALIEACAHASADRVLLGAQLIELTELQHRLREYVIRIRFDTLERIHEGLARLRAVPTTAALLAQAAEELARCCDLDRTVVSGLRGSSWRAEAVWIRPDHDPALARRIADYLSDTWIPLGSGALGTDLVRRRVAVLVKAGEDRAQENLMAVSESPGYVAAPIVANQRVIGFLHGDCIAHSRELTTLDRDNVASFAEGFGLVFERRALLERLERQRVRVHDAFGATERELGGLNDAETVLIRRDREAVAVVRMAAGLRRIAVSPIDQLLTVRERQVVELMVEGARNRQIADQLVVAEETVKSHVRSISRKLRASSRADAVSRYLQLRMREQA
jgi:DNA-binding CsgD family transcriptional regulator